MTARITYTANCKVFDLYVLGNRKESACECIQPVIQDKGMKNFHCASPITIESCYGEYNITLW